MASGPERRAFTRVPAAFEIDLWAADVGGLRGWLLNASLQGLYLSCERALSIGTRCQIALYPAGRGTSPAIGARGSVVRAEGELLTLRLDEIPYEDFERLRAFLLQNANDPALVDDELSDGLGFQPGD